MVEMRRMQGGSAPMDPRLRFGGIALVVLLLVLLIGSTMYQVDPEEVAVVTRFGKFVRTETPGAHLKLPWGIERAEKVRVGLVRKAEFGYRSEDIEEPGERTRYSRNDFSHESLMLTGDLNQADVEWTVQYRVKDPKAFLFNVRDPENTLRALALSTMRSVIGDHSIDEVLGQARVEIDTKAQALLQGALDLYDSGIDVVRVNLQNVVPPEEVKAAFEDVNKADQEMKKLINDARKVYSREVPQAKGQAEQIISAAEGYQIDRVNRASGEAERFNKVLAEYVKAPEVTRRRLYLEVMADILPRIRRKVIVDDGLEGLLPLLDLDDASHRGGG
jgi:membrane protease subunit HflK